MDNPKIKKPRSLKSADDGGWSGNNTHKHFRVNGASPDEKPSNGNSRTKRHLICKRSPDKSHHYDEIVCDYVTSYRERMSYRCSYCGGKSGGFYVNTGPLPEWLKKLHLKFDF